MTAIHMRKCEAEKFYGTSPDMAYFFFPNYSQCGGILAVVKN